MIVVKILLSVWLVLMLFGLVILSLARRGDSRTRVMLTFIGVAPFLPAIWAIQAFDRIFKDKK